jgi:hypothetical protein
MRKSLWNESSRIELVSRIERLEPDARPLWGKFTAPQMLAHLNDWMSMVSGDLATRNWRTILRRSPVKQLVIYWLPWPKGVPTAKELLAREPAEWSTERAELCRQLESFETHRGKSFPAHPAFGNLTADAWGVLGYRHTDHHLRQFGV